mmetsp:Transcript_49157/g.96361  ORF Transcript_49157/g.96361 Transcript_49157/m.96361 type:complete len:383 (-) Transcript_49157:71-1219(-)
MGACSSSQKSPTGLVASATSTMRALKAEEEKDSNPKLTATINADLSQMKTMLYGQGGEGTHEGNVEKLCAGVLSENLISEFINNLTKLTFDAGKDATHIINYLLKNKTDAAVEVFKTNPELLSSLVASSNNVHVALHCNPILRNCLCDDGLLSTMLNEHLPAYTKLVQMGTFDVASDAFATYKMMLTQNEELVSGFLNKKTGQVMEQFNSLLQCKNQVTKRMTVQLLTELLEVEGNTKLLDHYTSNADCVKLVMELLTGKAKAIQKDSFHLFAIIIKNSKSTQVTNTILGFKERAIEVVNTFVREPSVQPSDSDEEPEEERRDLVYEEKVANALKYLHDLVEASSEDPKASAVASTPPAASPDPESPPHQDLANVLLQLSNT